MEGSANKYHKIRQKILKVCHLEHWQLIALLLGVYDMISVNAAFFLALWVRFDCQ